MSISVSRRGFLILPAVGILSGCALTRRNDDDIDTNTLEKTSYAYRLADAAEGSKLIVANEGYNQSLTQEGLNFRMQKKGATLDEWKAFAAEQVLDWEDGDDVFMGAALAYLERLAADRGVELPEPDEIVFVRTTGAEEGGGATGYTHGTQIYVQEDIVPGLKDAVGAIAAGEELGPDLNSYIKFLAHELFHCLTRANPDFRKKMYSVIDFDVADEDYEFGPSVAPLIYANPDVEHHDASAVFTIDGKQRRCVVVFYVKEPFEVEGTDFFDSCSTGLVPIDDLDTLYDYEEATDFWEVLGRNTDYVIDPEECMADNFSDALVYGLDGKDYETPRIIEGIIEALKV